MSDLGETDRGAAERVAFFSDAVVAIAITLLAIELQVPEGDTWAELSAGFAAEWGQYLAFLISFLVIARHWMSHHQLYRYVRRTTTPVLWLNFGWLLMIILTPFLTKFIAERELDFARFMVYALGQSLQVGLFATLVLVLGRTGAFLPEAPASLTRRGWLPSVDVGLAFLLSIPLFLLVGQWAFLAWMVGPSIVGRVTRVLARP